MPKSLPSSPSLTHFKYQAKDLMRSHHGRDPAVCVTLRHLKRFARANDGEILGVDLSLQEAQYALAMDYGFTSWNELKKYVESKGGEMGQQGPKERADEALAELLAYNPGFTEKTPITNWLNGTNFVKYGAFGEEPVVFKYYDSLPRRHQEEKALRLFAPTGLVPRLVPVKSVSILAMQRLQGDTLYNSEARLKGDEVRQVYRALGGAIAKLVDFAPRDSAGGESGMSATTGFDYDFFCRADLPTLFDTVTKRAGRVLAEEDVPDKPILERSLLDLTENRDAILAYPTFIQLDDFHSNNIIVDGPHFQGFIDLEMTRYGNEVMVLAVAAGMAVVQGKDKWGWFREGYEDARGRKIDDALLSLVRIAASFNQWIRFMWYWTTRLEDLSEEGARGWPIRDIKRVMGTLAKWGRL